ncbi:adenosylcobinamide-GDP ribazoletransferase [Lysinibacillus sp. MHQ-1]|nr:adenosylcobinamide-GDP ribazoletransferase [Lysinibacillus sp. MHQ-1]
MMLLFLLLAMPVVLIITKFSMLPIILVLVLALALVIFRQFTLRNFGGVSGDLLGASIEGMEVVLWVTLLLCA